VARIKDKRLFAERLRERAGRMVLFGAYQSEIPAMIRDGLLTGGTVVWSLWGGYLNQSNGQRLQTALQAANIPLVQHHTSGHATPADLARLVQALRPDMVVPIHTEAPDAYAVLSARSSNHTRTAPGGRCSRMQVCRTRSFQGRAWRRFVTTVVWLRELKS
jgi:ribonuclease J